VRSHNKVRALFGKNKVRFARVEQNYIHTYIHTYIIDNTRTKYTVPNLKPIISNCSKNYWYFLKALTKLDKVYIQFILQTRTFLRQSHFSATVWTGL